MVKIFKIIAIFIVRLSIIYDYSLKQVIILRKSVISNEQLLIFFNELFDINFTMKWLSFHLHNKIGRTIYTIYVKIYYF